MVELAERDLQYEVVTTTCEFGGVFPALIDMNLQYIQYVDRDVLLARTDLPTEALSVSNPQSGYDSLWGGDDDDWLFGGLGNDQLDGGGGLDWLFGGPGVWTS